MKLNIQILDFNKDKVRYYDESKEFDYITIGDFSCSKRDILFLNTEFIEFIKTIKTKILIQLPLVVKENEIDIVKTVSKRINPYIDGFITGDLGIIKYIQDFNKTIIYTSNTTNKTFSGILKRDFKIDYVRPLMYKRTYINEKIDFPKDIVIYGNMMINCATFCYHSENDLIENCKFGCKKTRPLIMNNEKLYLIGRSLITDNKFDIIQNIDKIEDIEMGTIFDYNLKYEEVKNLILKTKKAII